MFKKMSKRNKIFLFIGLIIALVGVILIATMYSNKDNNIPGKFANRGVPVVEFKIGDEMVWFLVDTGAEVSMLDEEYFEEHVSETVNTDTLDYLSITANGVDTLRSVSANIMLNDSILVNLMVSDISIATKEMQKQTGKRVVGILGYDYINKKDIIFNYKEDRIKK